MPFKISHRAYFWLRVFAIVLVAAGIVQFIRVNRPVPVPETPVRVEYTTGSVVDGPIEVPAGEFLAYPIRLNRAATLKGTFRTAKLGGTIGLLALDEENFERWRNGGEFKAVSKTGNIPGGNVNARLQPGNYQLVFDNRHSANAPRTVEASFAIE